MRVFIDLGKCLIILWMYSLGSLWGMTVYQRALVYQGVHCVHSKLQGVQNCCVAEWLNAVRAATPARVDLAIHPVGIESKGAILGSLVFYQLTQEGGHHARCSIDKLVPMIIQFIEQADLCALQELFKYRSIMKLFSARVQRDYGNTFSNTVCNKKQNESDYIYSMINDLNHEMHRDYTVDAYDSCAEIMCNIHRLIAQGKVWQDLYAQQIVRNFERWLLSQKNPENDELPYLNMFSWFMVHHKFITLFQEMLIRQLKMQNYMPIYFVLRQQELITHCFIHDEHFLKEFVMTIAHAKACDQAIKSELIRLLVSKISLQVDRSLVDGFVQDIMVLGGLKYDRRVCYDDEIFSVQKIIGDVITDIHQTVLNNMCVKNCYKE